MEVYLAAATLKDGHDFVSAHPEFAGATIVTPVTVGRCQNGPGDIYLTPDFKALCDDPDEGSARSYSARQALRFLEILRSPSPGPRLTIRPTPRGRRDG